MKPAVLLSFFLLVQTLISSDTAMAQPPKAGRPSRHTPVQSTQTTGGLETIDPKEDKEREQGGWNGSYVGVNAGAAFGATAGTNVVVPLGTSEDR